MAFPDTITLTVNGVAKVLTKTVSGDDFTTNYRLREATQAFTLAIRHKEVNTSRGKIGRHAMEATQTVFATATTSEIFRKAYIVIEEGTSDDIATSFYLDKALVALCTDANIQKMLAYE